MQDYVKCNWWKYIKNHTIKNRVFKTLENLEDEVCEFFRNLTKDIVISICCGQLES